MGLEFMKRDKGERSSKLESKLDTKSKGETLKKSTLGKDFATQEQALKPTSDKGKGKDKKGGGLKETIGGLMSSVSQKLSGGSKTPPLSEEATKAYWQLAKKELGQKADLGKMMDKYGDLIGAFARSESSPELVEFYTAVKEGWPPEDLYATFIQPDSMMELNLPGNVREPLIALAQQGKYSEMDFTKASKVNNDNLMTDTLLRVVHDTATMREVFKRISGFTAPDKIGAGY